jgi:6-pyruvoyltetrahydropterin/6-carboxytetrahydropterin synthase
VAGVFEISASVHFDAAHWLRDYEGPCARMHGHRFDVQAAVTGSGLGREQLLMDFHELRGLLEEVIAPFDHHCLNDIEHFADLSPTSENIARFIYDALAERLSRLEAGVRLAWVSVSESPDTRVVYRESE